MIWLVDVPVQTEQLVNKYSYNAWHKTHVLIVLLGILCDFVTEHFFSLLQIELESFFAVIIRVTPSLLLYIVFRLWQLMLAIGVQVPTLLNKYIYALFTHGLPSLSYGSNHRM